MIGPVAPWRFQNPFYVIYREVWPRLVSCIGDFVDVVGSMPKSVSVQEGIIHLMERRQMSNGYVPGEFAPNRWTFPDRT